MLCVFAGASNASGVVARTAADLCRVGFIDAKNDATMVLAAIIIAYD